MTKNSILLIDPFENVLNVYQTVLEGEGFEVDVVIDLSQSIHFFLKKRYSIVITEFFVSLADTVNFIREIKKTAPETYIVLNTSTIIDDLTYITLFEKGLDDYLLKPYSPEKLLIHINKGLNLIRLILENREKESIFEPMARKGQQEIFNPSYFKKELRGELKKAKRHQNPMSLLLLKIPTKEIMGDRYETCYINLVKIIKSTLREEDVVGRENGKLGIILSQTDQTGSQVLKQRLYKKIRSHPSFKSDRLSELIAQELLFHSYTFPSISEPPEILKSLMEGVENRPPFKKH
jgi:PleD family two-component response regulator